MRILVVDDDALAGEMTAAILEGLGHTALLVEDGMEAIGKLNADESIELIVSDMHMPMVSGIDLFRELRDQNCTLPFILLTGDEPEGLLAQEPRLDACLLKDFYMGETLALVLDKVRSRSSLA